jgi:arylsulfatase A-like enzyme
MAETYRGVKQYPTNGISVRYSFDADPDGPTQRRDQCYEMMGTRGIWEDGWHAAATHGPLTGKGHFDQDRWELYHVAEDRSESTDLAE